MRTRTSITALAAALALAACEEPISLVPTGRAPPLAPRAAPAEAAASPAPDVPAGPRAGPDPVSSSGTPPSDAGAAPAAPAPAPAPALPSAAKLLRAAIAVEPTGAELPLSRDEETVVDPAATFRVEIGAALPDARLVLLDRNDAIVPSKGTREIGGATTFALEPAEPLVPASRYVLRVEGARTRELHDASGSAYTPFTMTVLVAGEPPKPEPKPAKRKRGRR
jgi:hypothetical protein